MLSLPISGIGAPILLILVVLSIFSIALIIMKAITLSRATGGQFGRTEALNDLDIRNLDVPRQKLGAPRTPADRIAVLAFDEIASGRLKGLDTTLEIAGNAESRSAFAYIRTLETIAMISPLLGLLGTVLGMIQAFQDLEMAEGAANAALLAGGIWQALLTTAMGLIVALPSATGAALLSARAETAVAETEETIARVLSAFSIEPER